MTITLEGQEALDYLDFLKTKPSTKIDEVKQPASVDKPSAQVEHQTEIMDDILFAGDIQFTAPIPEAVFVKNAEKPHSYPTGVTRTSTDRPRWSKSDIGVLTYRINPHTPAAFSERKLVNAQAKLPDRTEAAIRSKIIDLGGCVTNGNICKK